MADSNLVLHKGARVVERAELVTIEAPPATATWFPIKHAAVLETVEGQLADAGFAVVKSRLALSRDDSRFFGTLDLSTPVAEGVHLCVGVRNSIDKSFPIGFCCGERVFICDNLAFGASTVIAKKHTRFGSDRFVEHLGRTIVTLGEYREVAAQRIGRMREAELSDDRANSLILQAFERGIVNTRLLPKVIGEYRQPRRPDFEPRTAWSLLNAFTEVLKDRETAPSYSTLTIRLQGLLDPHFALGA